MKFVLIPPGEFLMGSTSAEIEDLLTQIADAESVRDRLQMESPQHRVVLTKAFYLGVHEVTQAQFAGVMGNNPSFHSSTGGGKDLVLQIDTSAYPVEQVSWNDTTEFCRRLSLQENVVPATSEPNRDSTTPNGSGYWLPTEAEWEFACRAGTTTWFWNGNEIENLKTIDLFGPTTGQVGQLKANPFGVHDLHGNVCEFVHDCWDPDSYKKHSGEPAIDPIGGVPEAHVLTLYRGSHWSGCDESARSAARKVGYERSTPVASHLGFRVKLPWTTVKEFLRSGNSRLHSAAGHSPQVPVGPSPFDAMSYSQIPEKERLDYLPKDVVAVLGTHEQKTWAAPARGLRQTFGTLDYSPDGKWICGCDWSNAYLFDATTLLLKFTIQNVSANRGSRRPLAFSPDSRSLFVGGIANHLFWGTAVVDLTTTEPSVKLFPMSDACLSGTAIAVAEQGNFVSYVDSAGTAIGTATRDPITGTMGKRTILPDCEEMSNILKSRGIGELAFSPDAEWLVTGYVGGGYQIFRRHSTDNGEFRPVDFIQTQPPGNGEMRVAFSFTPSHKRALLVEMANCRLLDLSLLDNLAEHMPVPPHLSLELDPPKELTNIKDISISGDGQTWVASQAVSDSCSRLLIGNWVDGRPEVQKSIDLPHYYVGRVALSPDASSVAVLANGHVLQVIDLTQNPPIKRPSLDETRMASNSDLSRTITVGTDGVIRLDATTPEKHEVLDSRQLDLGWADVRMSDDGKRAVSISVGDLNISKRSRIYVWNLEQDKLDKFAEFELAEGRENAWPVLFALGTRLLYGNQIWDISLPSPTVISDFVQLPPSPAASAVTEDGRLVAFATSDGQLALYATDGSVDRPLTTKKLPSSPSSLSFSPDGRRLVALFAGGIGTVWDLADGQLAEARQLPGQWQIPPGGPPYHMTSAIFSRDGHRVHFSGWGGVGEWNLDENKVTRFWPLPGFATLTMANDDRHLILNNSNCTTWILRLTEP